MRNFFQSSKSRSTRDDAHDSEQKSKTDSPSAPANPTFYHHPAPPVVAADSFSHTASSTAGYSQNRAYPTLANYHQEPNRSAVVEPKPTKPVNHLVEGDGIVQATNKLSISVNNGSSPRDLLRSGAIVQFLSKNSGCLLQVVMSPSGALVFDGNGAHNAFNTYFTVEEGEKGRIRFHNNCNYLAFDGKHPCILTLPPGPKNNTKIDFRVQEIPPGNELIALESCDSKNCFISILPDGHLKTTNLKEKKIDAQFSVIAVPIFPFQAPVFPQHQMHPYGMLPAGGPGGYATPQPAAQHIQASAPPAPHFEANQHLPASTSSSLYPKFN